jgi:elongation factor Tu
LKLEWGLFGQVLSEDGRAKAVAFDEIDKAPEEKQRGITIATVSCSRFDTDIRSLVNI